MNQKYLVVFLIILIAIFGGLYSRSLFVLEEERDRYRQEIERYQQDVEIAHDQVREHESTIVDMVKSINQYKNVYFYIDKLELDLRCTEEEASVLRYQVLLLQDKIAYLKPALSTALKMSRKNIRPFMSVEELETYLAGYEPGLKFFGNAYLSSDQCVASAMALAFDALEHGFWIETEVDERNHHAVCKTIIGGDYFFIDPVTKSVTNKLSGLRYHVGK